MAYGGNPVEVEVVKAKLQDCSAGFRCVPLALVTGTEEPSDVALEMTLTGVVDADCPIISPVDLRSTERWW